ncbi:MAG TPA: PRC-barrel domain-containing protein [Solirubrobacterales bacterium]|nr:PRC-barrel domain-containing protein [Solirubrobacterales bacterium]
MSESPLEPSAGALPSVAEALGWSGFELDDAGGKAVGRVEGVYADAGGGGPVWLVVACGRRRSAKTLVVPLRECAAMPGCVWIAQERETMLAAPAIDPTRPLLREHEVAICAHYGIGDRAGRHAEVVARPPGDITAQPA